MAQSVKHLALSQVMISWVMSSSPALGSVLTAQSLEPVPDSVSLSLCPSSAHALSLSLKNKINFKKMYLLTIKIICLGRLDGLVG